MDEYAHLLASGQIKAEVIEDLLVEVVSGKSIFESGGELYACRPATLSEQDAARVIYTRRLHEAKKVLPTRAQMEEHAIATGLFTESDRKEMAAQELLLQRNSKARDLTRDPQDKVRLSAEIEKIRTRMWEIKLSQEEVLAHSAESKADDARINYLVSACTMTGELLDTPVWSGWSAFLACDRIPLMTDARRAMVRASRGLPVKIIRAISRTGEWRTRWKTAKETNSPVFDGSSTAWDTNKRNLVWWSDFYDAILRHPECPPEATINDDDSLQDWLNQQIAKKNNPKGTPTPQNRTYKAGNGERLAMQKVGEETIRVNQPYKVRA